MMENVFLKRLSLMEWDYGYNDETLLRLEEHFNGAVVFANGQFKETVLKAVDVPDLKACVNDFPWTTGESELAAFVVLKGDTLGSYGINGFGSSQQDLAELVLGGVDWEKSRPPHDDVWSVWCGTFAEDSQQNKLSVDLKVANEDVCYRYYEAEKQFGIDMPSISEILKASSGYFLSNYFGVVNE